MDWSTAVPALIGAGGATLAGVIVAGKQGRLTRSNRRIDAYGLVMQFAYRTMHWVERTKPIIGFAGETPPDAPTMDEQFNVRSTMALFGTKKAKAAFEGFMDCVVKFTHTVMEMNITDAENKSGRFGNDDRNLWMELHEARKATSDAFSHLTETLPVEVED